MTREGYLLCTNVPFARTGEQWYGPGELVRDGKPIEHGEDGVVRVIRNPEDVFHEDALSSFNGKPFTIDHPRGLVTPDNVHLYEVGTILNPRKGEGTFDGRAVCDVLVKKRRGIDAVRKEGLREVSGGYEAEYQNLGPGRERQHSILGNHVALVKKGRCGSMCAIGDQEMKAGSRVMAWLAGRAPEEQMEFEAAMTSDAAVQTSDAKLDALGAKLDALPGALAAELAKLIKPEPARITADTAAMTADAAAAGVQLQDTIHKAYILAPTFKAVAMTADSVGDPAKVRTHDCDCKRGALKAAMVLDANKDIFARILAPDANVDTMDAAQVEVVFSAASEAVRARNNAVFAQAALPRSGTADADVDMSPSAVARRMNESARKKYAQTGAA